MSEHWAADFTGARALEDEAECTGAFIPKGGIKNAADNVR